MGTVTLPNTLANGPTHPNDATEVMANFNAILAAVNGGLDITNVATALANTFLKLTAAGDRHLAFGTAAPGAWGTVAQRDWTVSHGMGLTPTVAFAIEAPIATVSSAGVLLPVIVALVSKDGTNLTFRGRTADGANTNNANAVYWVAIG